MSTPSGVPEVVKKASVIYASSGTARLRLGLWPLQARETPGPIRLPSKLRVPRVRACWGAGIKWRGRHDRVVAATEWRATSIPRKEVCSSPSSLRTFETEIVEVRSAGAHHLKKEVETQRLATAAL